MISQRERGEVARFYTVTDPKKHHKGYTVYKVTARIISRRNPEDVQEITVWKRYSDFRKLHRDLWQIHKSQCQQSELFPPFAKAKVFGRFDECVIEERRQCSEDLLQFSANIPALYSSKCIEDFFKGGDVHDGSELIGPAEPFSDFLADSWSDCSSDVHKDTVGVDELTCASIQSEYGGPSSDSDLISLLVDTDSLADIDDGMASGGNSPNKLAEGRSPSPEPGRSGRAGSASLFTGALRPRMSRKDYVERASEQIRLAVQREGESDYRAALTFYQSGVDLLLQGVQGEPSPTRREAVKKKTAEYLMRAEQISSRYLREEEDEGTVHNVAPGPQGWGPTWSQRCPAEELKVFRVLGVIDKVLLVMDKQTQETFILKGLTKSSETSASKKTIVPRCVPNMVRLHKYMVCEDAVFLLLQHAQGGKLWSHVGKFLGRSPEESFYVPFMQKSQTVVSMCKVDSLTVPDVPGEGSVPLKSSLTTSSQEEEEEDDEECTNSYLTLCNEYEQEKIEPNSLEETGSLLRVEDEAPSTSRSHSLLSNDSLCSPASAAQQLHFFTEEEQSEVFAPSFSQAQSLDESKRTPMELFRIDSKDSTSDLLGLADPHPEAELPKIDLWLLGSDRDSGESVPVITFGEAAAEHEDDEEEDKGHPPDLLVNLPGVTVELDSAHKPLGEDKAPGKPHVGKPDVLQLHYDIGDDAALALCHDNEEEGGEGKGELCCDPLLGNSYLVMGLEVTEPQDEALPVVAGSESARLGYFVRTEAPDVDVSRLFKELDELNVLASRVCLPEEYIRRWAVEITSALHALHQEGIICRDLNPNNILLDDGGHIVLTYFCSWSDVEDLCDQEAIEEMYCAPEVGSICEETEACDWWSLGALLFELLTGKSVRQCHPSGISRHTVLNVPDCVSEEARSLLEQLLQFHPAERLGAGVAGVEDIKSHPFFAKTDWPK